MVKNAIILLFVLFSVGSTQVFSQRKFDLGAYVGGSYYLGDLNNSKQFLQSHTAIGMMIKKTYGTRWAIRLTGIHGSLSADDKESKYLYQVKRNYKFQSSLWDFAAVTELNFLPYRIEDLRNFFSPYALAGIGTFILPGSTTPVNLSIPFGVGIKITPFNDFSLGFEWAFRKTFTDNIDNNEGINAMPGKASEVRKQKAYFHQKDWFSLFGVYITYRFRTGGLDCKSYE